MKRVLFFICLSWNITNLVCAEIELPTLERLQHNNDFLKKKAYYETYSMQERNEFLLSELKQQNFATCLILISTGAFITLDQVANFIYKDIIPDLTIKFIFLNIDYKKYLDEMFYLNEADSYALKGKTLLMLLAEKGKMELVQLLIHQDANPHFKNQSGHKAQYFAHKNGHIQLAEYLASIPKPKVEIKPRQSCIIL